MNRRNLLISLILLWIVGVFSNIFTARKADDILGSEACRIYGVEDIEELNIGVVLKQSGDLFEDERPNTLMARDSMLGYAMPFILIYKSKYKHMFYGESADGPPKFRRGYVFVLNFFGLYALTDFFVNLDIEIPNSSKTGREP